jgi:hypothetical protein
MSEGWSLTALGAHVNGEPRIFFVKTFIIVDSSLLDCQQCLSNTGSNKKRRNFP